MTGRIWRRLGVATFLASVAPAVLADVTYTFNVPVELHQLPTALFDQLVVACSVEAGAEKLGVSDNVVVPYDAGGNAQTTLSVPVTLPESAAMRARLWRCTLFAKAFRLGYRIPYGLAFQPVADSTVRSEVRGELP